MVPPSHALFEAVFPDRLLCTEFEARLAAANVLPQPQPSRLDRGRAEMRAEMERKFGVDWQADDAADACTICHLKWTLVRRRHHCRSCGHLVCDSCSRARLHISGIDDQRACDHCVLRRASVESSQKAEPEGASPV